VRWRRRRGEIIHSQRERKGEKTAKSDSSDNYLILGKEGNIPATIRKGGGEVSFFTS